MSDRDNSTRSGIGSHFRSSFATGLLVLIPVGITYWVLKLFFDTIDGLLSPAIETIIGQKIPGAGLLILVVLVYIVGLSSKNILGRTLIETAQNVVLRIPIVNSIYSPARQLIASFTGGSGTGFKRVVIVEYPRVGAWTIGFLTGTTVDETGQDLAIVYIPTAPTPNSGWVAIFPAEQVHDTDMKVQMAIRMVLSGGIVTPEKIVRVQKEDHSSVSNSEA